MVAPKMTYQEPIALQELENKIFHVTLEKSLATLIVHSLPAWKFYNSFQAIMNVLSHAMIRFRISSKTIALLISITYYFKLATVRVEH